MSCKPCPHHCPNGSGTLLAALGAVLAVVLAVIVGQVVESLFATIVITGTALIAAGTGLFIWLVRRDRASPPARARAITGRVVQIAPPRTARTLPAAQLRAIEAPADARPGKQTVMLVTTARRRVRSRRR